MWHRRTEQPGRRNRGNSTEASKSRAPVCAPVCGGLHRRRGLSTSSAIRRSAVTARTTITSAMPVSAPPNQLSHLLVVRGQKSRDPGPKSIIVIRRNARPVTHISHCPSAVATSPTMIFLVQPAVPGHWSHCAASASAHARGRTRRQGRLRGLVTRIASSILGLQTHPSKTARQPASHRPIGDAQFNVELRMTG